MNPLVQEATIKFQETERPLNTVLLFRLQRAKVTATTFVAPANLPVSHLDSTDMRDLQGGYTSICM